MVFLIIALPIVSAAESIDMQLVINGDEERTSSGVITVEGTLTNPSGLSVSGITLSVTASGLTTSGLDTSAFTLAAGEEKTFAIQVTGFPWTTTKLTIKAEWEKNTDYRSGSVSESINIVSPELDIEIVGPETDLTLVVEEVLPENQVDFYVLVKNPTVFTLEGVGMGIEFQEDKLSCTGETTAKKNIAGGKTERFSISCTNVSKQDRLRIEVMDKYNSVRDNIMITFNFVERVKDIRLEISSPVENAEFRLGEYGGSVKVTAKNVGEVGLAGVCAYVESMEFTSDGCVDIPVGAEHTFNLNLVPTENFTNVYIYVNDAEKRAEDSVTVRVLMIKAIIPVKNDTPGIIEQNDTPPVETNTSVEPVEPGLFDYIPSWVLILLVILIPIIILAVYIKVSISKVDE